MFQNRRILSLTAAGINIFLLMKKVAALVMRVDSLVRKRQPEKMLLASEGIKGLFIVPGAPFSCRLSPVESKWKTWIATGARDYTWPSYKCWLSGKLSALVPAVRNRYLTRPHTQSAPNNWKSSLIKLNFSKYPATPL